MVVKVLFILIALAILAAVPKKQKDYSHVPEKYMHLVGFAESAGM
jgi:hypothetical protein